MMKSIHIFSAVLIAAVLAVGSVSCSSKDSDSDSYAYVTSMGSVLVSQFMLVNDNNVMTNLDSVYFTIDPERSVIYNADSLPKGTNVSSLKTTLVFNNPIGTTVFRVKDADNVITEYEYNSVTSAALDFRYGVTLRVTSLDGLRTKDYEVKVNVHKINPDSLVWPMGGHQYLPGADSDNKNLAIGVAECAGKYWCMLERPANTLISVADTPAGPWTTSEIDNDANIESNTLTGLDDTLYALDSNGTLCYSDNGVIWERTTVKWRAILGAYGDRLLGIDNSDTPCYDEYPRRSNFVAEAVEDGFPVKGFSQMVSVYGDWAVSSLAMIVGGTDINGTKCNSTWAYDGNEWAQVNSGKGDLPALDGPTLISYHTFTFDVPTLRVSSRVSWLVMGGVLANDEINLKTYVSHNRGITWAVADSTLTPPPAMPAFSHAKVLVHNADMKSGAVEWQCPYIYLFGGYDANDELQNSVWMGVIPRLSFKPIF